MSLLAPVSRVGVGGALLGCGTGKVLFDLITGLESLLALSLFSSVGEFWWLLLSLLPEFLLFLLPLIRTLLYTCKETARGQKLAFLNMF